MNFTTTLVFAAAMTTAGAALAMPDPFLLVDPEVAPYSTGGLFNTGDHGSVQISLMGGDCGCTNPRCRVGPALP